jgi:hypothetical protein
MEPNSTAALIDHLNGVIFLARVTWATSSGTFADIAQTFRQVSHMHHLSALIRLDDPAAPVLISDDSLC